MSIKIKGLDKLQRDLNSIAKKAQELEGQRNVTFDELFNESFMNKHTSFTNFNDFLVAGGFIVNSAEDFKAIPDDDFDEYIRNSTKFASWSKMQEEATGEYVARQLGF